MLERIAIPANAPSLIARRAERKRLEARLDDHANPARPGTAENAFLRSEVADALGCVEAANLQEGGVPRPTNVRQAS